MLSQENLSDPLGSDVWAAYDENPRNQKKKKKKSVCWYDTVFYAFANYSICSAGS